MVNVHMVLSFTEKLNNEEHFEGHFVCKTWAKAKEAHFFTKLCKHQFAEFC